MCHQYTAKTSFSVLVHILPDSSRNATMLAIKQRWNWGCSRHLPLITFSLGDSCSLETPNVIDNLEEPGAIFGRRLLFYELNKLLSSGLTIPASWDYWRNRIVNVNLILLLFEVLLLKCNVEKALIVSKNKPGENRYMHVFNVSLNT